MSYWTKRQTDELNRIYDVLRDEADKRLLYEYQRTYNKILADINDLWLKIQTSDGKINLNDLYRYDRYYRMLGNIATELKKLGDSEHKILSKVLEDMYYKNSAYISDVFSLTAEINVEYVKNAINSVWCADGKNWSSRIWTNKNLFTERLRNFLVDMVATGESHDVAIAKLRDEFGVDYYKSQRLVRTELCHVQTMSTYDRYDRAGIKFFDVLDAGDYPGSGAEPERECEHCHEIADKGPYAIEGAKTGVTLPPFHPNCRCVMIPVVD